MSNNRDLGRLAANLTVSGQNVKISNVTDPTADQDVATKKYVDDATPDINDVSDSESGLIPAYPSDISGGQYDIFWGGGEGWRSSGVGVYNGKEGSDEIVYHPNNGNSSHRFTQQSVDDDTLEVHKADSSTLQWRVKDRGISSSQLALNAVLNENITDSTISIEKLDISSGSAGQVLTLDSSGNDWEWADVPDSGDDNDDISGDITVSNDVATISDDAITATKLANNAVEYGKINITGTAGQIIQVNSNGTDWEFADADTDFTSITGDINVDSSNVARLQSGSVRYAELDQQTNVAGRVLTSTGTDWEWKDAAAGLTAGVGIEVNSDSEIEVSFPNITDRLYSTSIEGNDDLIVSDDSNGDATKKISFHNLRNAVKDDIQEDDIAHIIDGWLDINPADDDTRPSATGSRSLATGVGSVASDYGAIAVGTDAQASGHESMSVGHQSKATHDYAASFGWRSESREDYDITIGSSSASVRVHPNVAGHETHATQLVSKEYVDSRIASQNSISANSTLRNTLTTSGEGTVTNDAWANYTHFGRTGVQQSDGTTNESYYYCSGFYSNTNPNQVNNGPLTHFPTEYFSRVSGEDVVPTIGQDGSQFDSDNNAYPELFRYNGKNGAKIWAEDDIPLFAQFGWRNFSNSDVSNFTVPEARIRLQLVILPHNVPFSSLNESNAVVVLTSKWNHLNRQSISLINDGTTYTVDDPDDYFDFTVGSLDAEKAFTINNGDYLAWRWQYHFVNTHSATEEQTFDFEENLCFEVNSRYRNSTTGTNGVYSMNLDFEIPVPEHELILHPDTDDTNGDLIYLDNTDTDNPIEYILWDASAAEIPPSSLNSNVVINAVTDDTNGSIELTKANGDSVDFTRSYSDWDRTLDYDDKTTVTYNDRIYRANRDVSAVPDWDTNSSYSAGTTVFYVDKFYTALFSRDADDPAPADDGSNWRVTEAVQPQRNPSWDELTPITGGTNQVASSDEETPANAYGQDTIAIGAGARAGEQVIVNFTGITYYSDTLVQLLGATYNGSPISSSNSITIVADTIVTVTQGTNVVDLTMSGDNTLNQSSPLLITTGDGDELVNGNTPGTLTLGQGQDALALGNGAVANHESSVVIGKDGSSTADNQLLISDEITTIRLDGYTGGTGKVLGVDSNGDLSAVDAVDKDYFPNRLYSTNIANGDDFLIFDANNDDEAKVISFFNVANALEEEMSAFTGADGTDGGSKGLVPAPSASDNTRFLRGDGTWATVSGGGGDVNQDVFLYSDSESYSNGQVVLFQGEWWRWSSATDSVAGVDPTESTDWLWCGVPNINGGTLSDGHIRVDLRQSETEGRLFAEVSINSINSIIDDPEEPSYEFNDQTSSDDRDQVAHNFSYFQDYTTGAINQNTDVNIYSRYTAAQESAIGSSAPEGLISRIIKPFEFNTESGNDYPRGWVIKTFHYNSDELVSEVFLTWIDIDTNSTTERNAIFGSSGDTDEWAASDDSQLTPVGSGLFGHYRTGHWTGFDKSNSNVTLGNSGNVRLLGHKRYFYDSDGNIENVLDLPRTV